MEDEPSPAAGTWDELNARRGAHWRWPNATIPYAFNASANFCGPSDPSDEETPGVEFEADWEKAVIGAAMVDYARYTCIRWVPRTTQPDYVYIFSGSG